MPTVRPKLHCSCPAVTRDYVSCQDHDFFAATVFLSHPQLRTTRGNALIPSLCFSRCTSSSAFFCEENFPRYSR